MLKEEDEDSRKTDEYASLQTILSLGLRTYCVFLPFLHLTNHYFKTISSPPLSPLLLFGHLSSPFKQMGHVHPAAFTVVCISLDCCFQHAHAAAVLVSVIFPLFGVNPLKKWALEPDN